MFDATLHKQKMFDQTKRSAIKLKDIPCKKGFIVFFWRATDFILSHRVLRNACRNIRLLTIHTNHPGKNFLHKHGFIRFGRAGRIARTMYKHTEKSRKLSRFQSVSITANIFSKAFKMNGANHLIVHPGVQSGMERRPHWKEDRC